MRILTISGLFPSRTSPAHGVFVLQRTKALRDAGHEVRVLAPVPWVPPVPLPARFRKLRATPRDEVIEGLPVRHPRYFMIPKIGMYAQDRLYALGIRRAVREAVESFDPEILDVHYLYPDACGVARVAKGMGLPYVCSARGSDVKTLARIPVLARRIRRALRDAAAVIAVSRDLAETIRQRGLFDGGITVIPNGIDPDVFHPRSRSEARTLLGLPPDAPIVVCVGHLAPSHGQHLILEAFGHPETPTDAIAYLVGGGDGLEAMRREVARRDLGGRIHLPGPAPHAMIPLWFAAANASLHPGSHAGCPNAVLESLACGTPCLASDIPEMHEVIDAERQGILVAREPAAIARGIARLLRRADSPAVRPAAPRTWAQVAGEVSDLFEAVRPVSARSGPEPRLPRTGGARD